MTHRDDYNLSEKFPAFLVINQNIIANSWEEKQKPISEKHFSFAAQKNVVICRVEDLINLWYSINQRKLKQIDLLELFTTSKGWLEIKKNSETVIHPSP